MTALIEACEVSRVVGRRALVDRVSLTVEPGETVILLGPNGAGKTTFLRMLAGELVPSAGTIAWEDAPIARWKPRSLAAKRAVMSQSHPPTFPFSVFEVISIGLEGIGRGCDRRRRLGAIEEALAAADLAALAGADYGTLSGGERQRVQFARALAQLRIGGLSESRQVLFLDEPVASLDLCHQLVLMDRAADLAAEGIAVVAVLHDLNLAVRYADRLVVLAEGRVRAIGRPATVVGPQLLRDVFGIDLPIGGAPPADMPFVLPQLHRPRRTAGSAMDESFSGRTDPVAAIGR